ncbi:MAG: 16S rRNA (adenine(1518)-N(6)/adenine(1519)-N(6))-dimethyltransferase RsmA [Parcubacteria group bacterium]
MKAKKSLGQNFLKSERALRKIVEVGELESGEVVFEIGPGRGALTEKLLEKGVEVLAVEKDDELFEFLKEKFEKEISSGQLTLIHDDILNLKPPYFLLPTTSYKLVANIPYNITGAIFKKFLETKNQPEKMVLLVQKEVAERVVARDEKESILSLSVKAYGQPKYIETVKAGSFTPAPNVDSAILTINDISKGFFTSFSEEDFFKILKTSFQSKRKKLSSNLSNLFSKDKVRGVFEKIGLDDNIRAEDIKLADWQKISETLK